MPADVKTIEGRFDAGTGRYGILVARWNHFVVDALVEGAVDTLRRHGIGDDAITVVKVPGSFELPVAARKMAESGSYDAIVALGAVIRGGTPHFDYVAGQTTSGLAQVSLSTGVPVAFGVLTTDSIEQAIERSGTKAGNKGEEAALTALEMVSLLGQL